MLADNANNTPPLIIAHRGASALAPENTLAAFQMAIEDGADGVEFDVRISRDGTPVIFHDSTLKRMSNGSKGEKENHRRTSTFTVDELQTLDLGKWFNDKSPDKSNEKFSGETVPTLAKFFSLLKGYDGRLYLEMKGNQTEISALAEVIAKVVSRSEFLPQIIVKSFKLEAVEKVKKLLPEVRAAALFAPKITTILRKQRQIIEQARAHLADELSLHYSLATEKLVQNARSEKMATTIWTADHPIWVRRAAEIGIYAIITNNPARLLKKRREIFPREEMMNIKSEAAAD